MKNYLFAFIGFLIGLFYYNIPDHNPLSPNEYRIYLDNKEQIFYSTVNKENYFYQNLKYEQIPPPVIDATVYLEDRSFWHHLGFSPLAILRSIYQNQQANRIVSGGSGITQQLARAYLKPEKRSYWQKIQEIYLALGLEKQFSKKEIISNYLNSIFYGNKAYGISAAAYYYFDKTPAELNLREVVFLSGLPQSPSRYNPFKYWSSAQKREKIVIKQLWHNGFFRKYCPQAQQMQDLWQNQCLSSDIKLKSPPPRSLDLFQHYRQMIDQEIKQTPFANSANLTIYSYLDSNLQKNTQNIIEKQLIKNKDKKIGNAAAIIFDHQHLSIPVLIGSANYGDHSSQGYVNNAISYRQPGSTIKAFTYALAIEKGDFPDTTVEDSFVHYKTGQQYPYEPKNYDFKEYGLVTYRQALANSYNISAIKVAEKVGIENLLNFLRRLGMENLDKKSKEYGLALTLGDGEV
nr:transglycosylase domain-containing protein [Candidatus Gracilibacteria bacterium]